MNILDIIEKKRDAKELNKEEIEFFVKGYTDGSIPDYQAAALVMAIYINGMTKEETTNLALAMAYSGDVLDLSDIGEVVDKHSTGGIGENVKKIGISLIGQTLNLAPADKKLYALRDTISCTANIPLISSSIMSKKIAEGANKIVLDVTCGSGAFMKTVGEARELSKTLIDIGKLANKETVCIITNMDQPLGTMVGNILEVIEAIEALKGNMQDDVKNVVLELGAYILKLDGKGDNIQDNKEKIEQVISNGDAYKKFLQLVENQGGDISYIENTEKFTKAKYKMPVEAVKTGYVQKLNAEDVGKIAMHLGAGRMKKEDNIDYAVGIELLKKVGCHVEQGEIIAYIYAEDEQKGREAVEKLQQTYEIGEQNVEKVADIIEIIE